MSLDNSWARPALLSALSLLFAAALAAQEPSEPPVATISFESGPVSIRRDGEAVAAHDIGDPIYDDDFISTGSGASLVFDLLPRTGMRGSVSLQQKTSLYFRLDTVKGERQSQAELIAGQVAVKVKRLSGSPGFSVATESTVCGVRGTEFEVTSAPGGDLLVACSEGEVACSSEGSSESALPGQVVEKREGQRLGRKAVAASAYADFKRKWVSDEEEAFRRNAPKAARQILLRYLELQRRLGQSAEAIAKDRDIRALLEQKRKGQAPGPAELADLERRGADIGKRLAEARSLLSAMERIEAQVSALGETLDRKDPKLMETELREGLSLGSFFDRFEEMRANDLRRSAELRTGVKLFRQRMNAIEEKRAAPPAGDATAPPPTGAPTADGAPAATAP